MYHLVREHPLFHVVLCLLIAALAYGTFRHLTAHAAHPTTATAEIDLGLLRTHGDLLYEENAAAKKTRRVDARRHRR